MICVLNRVFIKNLEQFPDALRMIVSIMTEPLLQIVIGSDEGGAA